MTSDPDDEDPWAREPPVSGPSAPHNLNFNPLATGIGVFVAVAVPIVVVGFTRPAGTNGTIIAIGIVVGLIAGVLAGVWVAGRGGEVWRGRQF